MDLHQLVGETRPLEDLYIELGKTYLSQHKYRKAIENFLAAKEHTTQKGGDWKTAFYLAHAYQHVNQFQAAFLSFMEALTEADSVANKNLVKNSLKEIVSMDTLDYYKESVAQYFGEHPAIDVADATFLRGLETSVSTVTPELENAKPSDQIKEEAEWVLEIEAEIASGSFDQALTLVDQALEKIPHSLSFLFLKIRILTEGQIDWSAAIGLLNDKDFGYRKHVEDGQLITQIQSILVQAPDSGNAYLFAAFLGRQLKCDLEQCRAWLQQAEVLGVRNQQDYPEMGLYYLKAEFAEQAGEKEEAALNFYELARTFYWRSRYQEAAGRFEKAIKLDPALADAFNYYADNQMLLSYTSEPPYNDPKLVEQAYEIWHRSPVKYVTDASQAWYYNVIARIHGLRYLFLDRDYTVQYWQAALYGERALMHQPDDSRTLQFLAGFYRDLTAEANSQHCFELAQTQQDDEEWIRLQLNRGHFDGPQQLFEQWKQSDQEAGPDLSAPQYLPYRKAWHAFILFFNGSFAEARKLLDEVLVHEHKNLFAWQLKMFAYWYETDAEKARETAEQILDLGGQCNFVREDSSFAWAWFIRGNTAKAIELLEDVVERDLATDFLCFNLSEFYLHQGDLERASVYFERFIQLVYNRRTLIDFRMSMVPLRALVQQAEGQHADLKKRQETLISDWEARVEEKLQQVLASPQSPLEEFAHLLSGYDFQQGTIPWLTTQVGMARLHKAAGRWAEAVAIYQSIHQLYRDVFPESEKALSDIESILIQEAGKALSEKNYAAVPGILKQMEFSRPDLLAVKQFLSGAAHYHSGDKQAAKRCFQQVLLRLTEPEYQLQQEVWNEWMAWHKDKNAVWDLGIYMQELASDMPPDQGKHVNNLLEQYFWSALYNIGESYYPVVSPILLDLHPDLLNNVWNLDNDGYLIKERLPRLIEKVGADFGVRVPLIRCRINESDLAHDNYMFLLEEVPRIQGTISRDQAWWLASRDAWQSAGIAAPNVKFSHLGHSAAWLSKEQVDAVHQAGFKTDQDPMEFVMQHLYAAITANLDQFIDLQTAKDYLESIPDQPDSVQTKTDAVQILEDPSLLQQLSSVMKALAREAIPLKPAGELLQSFLRHRQNNYELDALVAAIRMDLRTNWTENFKGLRTVNLADETMSLVRQGMQTEEGKSFLSLSPDDCQSILSELRSQAPEGAYWEDLVFIVNDPELRIHIRRLADLEWVTTSVVASQELDNHT